MASPQPAYVPVPAPYDKRMLAPELTLSDLAADLILGVTTQPFDPTRDGRPAIHPGRATDTEIRDRIQWSWLLRRYVLNLGWSTNPSASPRILAGFDVNSYVCIGAAFVDTRGWDQALNAAGGSALLTVPLLPTPGLDAGGLRGRRLDRSIRLGHIRPEQTVVVDAAGRRI